MSAAIVTNLIRSPIGRLPFPIFGTVATVTAWGRHSSRSLKPLVGWGFPLVVGGLWFIWPAVDDEWQMEIGFKRNPNPPPPAPKPEIKLDASATAAIDNAYKPAASEAPTEKDIQIGKELRMGETTTLEEEWDNFLAKVSSLLLLLENDTLHVH